MHNSKSQSPMVQPSQLEISQSLLDSVNSVTDDPFNLGETKRKPKKYSLLWICSRQRPIVTIQDDSNDCYLTLYTSQSLALQEHARFCHSNSWPDSDVEVRKYTFAEALELARSIQLPIVLVRDLGVRTTLNGVLVEMKNDKVKFYPL
jgi:hypothetical protein